MVVPFDIEVRPLVQLTAEEKAIEHDSRVREIDRIVRESWSELAAICIQVRDKQEWKFLQRLALDIEQHLGRCPVCGKDDCQNHFYSFDWWLIEAAPVCRATIYKGMGILSVIAADLSPAQIADMEIGKASLMAQVSPSVRRDPEIIEAARSGRDSKKLRSAIRKKYPEQHIELMVEKKLHFTASQWEVIEPKYEAYQLVDAGASLEEFIEWLCSETS